MASRRKLRFLVDACVSADISNYLAERKKVALVSFEEAGLTNRSEDARIIENATRAGAIVMTSDKRFTESHIPLCTHAGILKFSVHFIDRLNCLKKFLRLPERHKVWKSVTHIFKDRIEISQHVGRRLTVLYPR